MNKILVIFSFLVLIPFMASAVDINACQDISSNGTYTLTQNISTTGNCITINVSNVNINCNGYTINGSGESTSYAISFDSNLAGLSEYALQNLTVTNCKIRNFDIGFNTQYALNMTISNNIMYNNPSGIASAQSRLLNVSNNTITNATYGIIESPATSGNYSANNTIENNIIYNVTYGVYYANSVAGTTIDNTTLRNNTIYNASSQGIYISAMSNVSFYNNTIYLTQTGILIDTNSNDTFLFNNTIHSNRQNGVSTQSKTHFLNNTIYNNTHNGLYAIGISNSNLTLNTIYNNSYSGFNFGSSHVNLTNNSAYNNTLAGFFFNGSTTNLTGNNATSNLQIQYNFVNSRLVPSRGNFTGLNYALNTSRNGFDLNTSGGSNATTLSAGAYNVLLTTYGQIFFDNANNVSVKTMNLSDSGAASTGCTSGLSGTCELITNNSNVVNITNTSTNARINLGIMYNATASTNSSGINVSRYSSGWSPTGQTTINTSTGRIRYDGITSFSTFAVVNFYSTGSSTPAPTPTTTTRGTSQTDYDSTTDSENKEEEQNTQNQTNEATNRTRVLHRVIGEELFYLIENTNQTYIIQTNTTLCNACIIQIESPTGQRTNLTPDISGQIDFTPNSPGNYTLTLFSKNHTQVAVKKINIPNESKNTNVRELREDYNINYLIIITLTISVIVAYYIWHKQK